MVIAGDGFSVSLAGEWRAKVEETWDGARRREVITAVPIAEQFLLANSPVADMFKASASASTVPGGAASTRRWGWQREHASGRARR